MSQPVNRSGFCEWDPGNDRPAQGVPTDRVSWYTDYTGCDRKAVLIVGGGGKWRLCGLCAALPRFKRFRKRVQIIRIETRVSTG